MGRESNIHTIAEYQHTARSDIQLWTLPSLAVFICPLLGKDLTQIDWFTMYDWIRFWR